MIQQKKIYKLRKQLEKKTVYNFFSFFIQFFIIVIDKVKYKRLNKANDTKKSKKPLISIYTPTYNRASILKERAIKSVLRQSYKNFEYIIVGDGCTDNTEKIVKKINDKRIKFVNIPRKIKYKKNIENIWFVGPVMAANHALKLVKGEYIARIDDDDIWTKDHLKSSLNFLKNKNLEFITSKGYSYRYGRKIESKPDIIEGIRRGNASSYFYRSYLKIIKYNIYSWMKSNNRVNDLDFFERLNKIGVRIGYKTKPTVQVVPRPGEKTIGIDQYFVSSKKYLKKYLS